MRERHIISPPDIDRRDTPTVGRTACCFLWRSSSRILDGACILGTDRASRARLRAPVISEEALRNAQVELAHVSRITTLGLLSASIAHEVNQPVAAAVTNADAGLRWLATDPPNLEEARRTFGRIINDCNRASAVIGSVRTLATIGAAPLGLARYQGYNS